AGRNKPKRKQKTAQANQRRGAIRAVSFSAAACTSSIPAATMASLNHGGFSKGGSIEPLARSLSVFARCTRCRCRATGHAFAAAEHAACPASATTGAATGTTVALPARTSRTDDAAPARNRFRLRSRFPETAGEYVSRRSVGGNGQFQGADLRLLARRI